MFRNLLFILIFASLSGSAWAESKDPKDVKDAREVKDAKDVKEVVVRNAWVSETAPGQTKASVQMDITCVDSIGKLVAVDSPLAESVELQRLRPSRGRLEVETLTAVAMRHGHPMSFGPRTNSIMLLGLKQPLKAGDVVPVNLTINTGGKQVIMAVKVKVKPLETADAGTQAQSGVVPTHSGVAPTQSGVVPTQSGVMPGQPATK